MEDWKTVGAAQQLVEDEIQLLSIDWLLAQRDLELIPLHTAGQQFHVAHPCELEDPTEFIGPGGVVLLTGLAFKDHPERFTDYVRRLAERGLTGIGFGTGLYFDDPPRELIDAAKAQELTLFEVPLHIPFVSISAAAYKEQSRRRGARREQFVKDLAKLSDAASIGLRPLLKTVAKTLDCRIYLADMDSRIKAAVTSPTRDRLPETITKEDRALVEEVMQRGFGSAFSDKGRTVLSVTVTTRGDYHEGLIASTEKSLDVYGRTLLKHAAGLCELLVQRPSELRFKQNGLNTLALAIQLGWTGDTDTFRDIIASASDATGKIRPALVKSDDVQARDRFHQKLDMRLEQAGRMFFSLNLDDCTQLILFRGGRSMKELKELLSDLRHRQRIVVGGPVEWAELSQSLIGELERIAFRVKTGSIVGVESRAFNWLHDAADVPALRSRVQETWGKLHAYDESHDTYLRRTLEVLLQHGMHLGDAADILGVHRHTLRKRVSTLESVLEVDLGDPSVRAELLVLGMAIDPQRSTKS
ncbi:MAG: PucR family transcriptional regulator [Corynebacterium camporealensis]|uniref:PucR family transcriptional regulator n=1 Tax=Corynebacterium camporealensis TaxID=161896 RepID=UPI002A908CFA|nr:PucR family transcriptional regulator [Corynebacterium camporealensis]MDY5839387.1 PucR family transcriptional regulator [Corynebacterium camporealensis]